MKTDTIIVTEDTDRFLVKTESSGKVTIAVSETHSALRYLTIYLSKKQAILLWKQIGRLKLIGEKGGD